MNNITINLPVSISGIIFSLVENIILFKIIKMAIAFLYKSIFENNIFMSYLGLAAILFSVNQTSIHTRNYFIYSYSVKLVYIFVIHSLSSLLQYVI
jgi:hypothetical protein